MNKKNIPLFNLKEQHDSIKTELNNAALEALKGEGIPKVYLVVFRDNVKGQGFWERMGFSVREDLVYFDKMIGELTYI